MPDLLLNHRFTAFYDRSLFKVDQSGPSASTSISPVHPLLAFTLVSNLRLSTLSPPSVQECLYAPPDADFSYESRQPAYEPDGPYDVYYGSAFRAHVGIQYRSIQPTGLPLLQERVTDCDDC